MQKGGVKSLLMLLTKSIDADAQRFAALALGNAASAGNRKCIRFFKISPVFSFLSFLYSQLLIEQEWQVKGPFL